MLVHGGPSGECGRCRPFSCPLLTGVLAARVNLVVDLCKEASLLLPAHPAASCVFSATAVEVFFKDVVLRPMVSSFVTNDSVSKLLVSLVVSQRRDCFKKILYSTLEHHAEIDLATFRRPSGASTLWKESNEIQELRNSVVHSGRNVQPEEAMLALDVSCYVVGDLFRAIIGNLGLHVLDDGEICTTWGNRSRSGGGELLEVGLSGEE